MTPFEIIAPNGAVEHCEDLTLPRGSLFQIVSHYSSDLLEDEVPASARPGTTLFGHGQSILSGVCVVHVRSRSVVCTDDHRWTVEPRPPGMQ